MYCQMGGKVRNDMEFHKKIICVVILLSDVCLGMNFEDLPKKDAAIVKYEEKVVYGSRLQIVRNFAEFCAKKKDTK